MYLIEDEYHALIVCPQYMFRTDFININYTPSGKQYFLNLLMSENPCTISETAKLVFNIFKQKPHAM